MSIIPFYIRKIIRDDGEALDFNLTEIYLAHDNDLAIRPNVESVYENFTEADGGILIAQKRPSYVQPIKGLIIPKTTSFHELRNKLIAFFIINHTYEIVYQQKKSLSDTNFTSFKTTSAWIEEALQVPPTPYEDYAEFSISLRVGSPEYLQYAEDENGTEIPANVVILHAYEETGGGEKWGSVGQEWDNKGAIWETGGEQYKTVSIFSTQKIFPTLTVEGMCKNPTLLNLSNGKTMTYTGTIAERQKLVIDFSKGTAKLDGISVKSRLSGDIVLDIGENLIEYTIDSGNSKTAQLGWNNYIG